MTTETSERIIFQNETCIVINKTAGESSEAPNMGEEWKGSCFPVHRIDVPVTGCLLIAKTQDAASFLSSAFASSAAIDEQSGKKTEGQTDDQEKERRVKKYYWAIAEMPADLGSLAPEAQLVHWITENRKLNKSFATADINQITRKQRGSIAPRKAIMNYKIIGKGERYIFLEIELVSGRHHQIRAQLAALGLYIKGDLKYGARRSEKGGGIRLHAHSLSFPDPLNPKEQIEVKVLPHEMDALWTAFKSEFDKSHCA